MLNTRPLLLKLRPQHNSSKVQTALIRCRIIIRIGYSNMQTMNMSELPQMGRHPDDILSLEPMVDGLKVEDAKALQGGEVG